MDCEHIFIASGGAEWMFDLGKVRAAWVYAAFPAKVDEVLRMLPQRITTYPTTHLAFFYYSGVSHAAKEYATPAQQREVRWRWK